MKKIFSLIVLFSSVFFANISLVWPKIANQIEIKYIAENWINIIIDLKGNWGSTKNAYVKEIQPLKQEDRVIGYYCDVQPQGFIVLSTHKTLNPIKAYSTTGRLNPLTDKGLIDVINIGLERNLKVIGQKFKSIESVQATEIENNLGVNYQKLWQSLISGVQITQLNYQGGDTLLTSNWQQRNPYNKFCPGDEDENCDHCPVGCVALAAAQIMRYWNWPPYGVGEPYNDSYDWVNMLDELTRSSDEVYQDAIAELCYEIGHAVDIDYKCDGSGVNTKEMEDVYEDVFRFASGCQKKERDDYNNAVDWFVRIKTQLNFNRPLQYKVKTYKGGHSIVIDGWQEITIDGIYTRQYHVNYGWADKSQDWPEWTGITNSNIWFTLDELPGSDIDDEYVLENIYPDCALGAMIAGTYNLESIHYRYFDMDATGGNAVFVAGHRLQFLPGIKVTANIGTGIKFEGNTKNSKTTHLFTKADMTKGIKIFNGGIHLHARGGMILY